ncbi:MAG: TetR family transcriptional regulator, partial [Actinobacteria bacterium]|nr:TetR family transcriptional regulator [Actinomycetota bacterium]
MAVETKERIVRAAEILFAKEGYAGTSLRQITESAGVNIAAVNYHFGSKENLLIEILDRVVGPINAERLLLLDEAQAEGTPDITA